MKITLNYTKSVNENAGTYFDRSKKAKKKLTGLQKAMQITAAQLAEIQKNKEQEILKHAQKATQVKRKVEWFEKFRWFYTSNAMLAIGGRDANSNELVIKKHVDAHDLIFHTDMAGSPFFILKTEGKEPTKEALEEVAQVTACYSKAWQKGFSSLAVFYVKPEQVSKEANTGEFVKKGSFIIRGKTTYLHPVLQIVVGIDESGRIICGTEASVRTQSKKYKKIIMGSEKPSSIAKKLLTFFGGGDLDEIIRMLPASNVQIV